MEYNIDCTGWNKEAFVELFSSFSDNTTAKIVLYVEDTREVSEQTREKIVADYLIRLGVPIHLKGYGYLKCGILRCLDHSEELESMTKILYPNIAEKYNTTVGKVEHGIRHAIQKAWEVENKEGWEKVFGKGHRNLKSKPTNSYFIAALCDHISLNH